MSARRPRKTVKYTFSSDDEEEYVEPVKKQKKQPKAEETVLVPLPPPPTSNLLVERLLCRREMSDARWNQLLLEMNTREVTNGSLFHATPTPASERFLGKVANLFPLSIDLLRVENLLKNF